jgi:hypothetical protein
VVVGASDEDDELFDEELTLEELDELLEVVVELEELLEDELVELVDELSLDEEEPFSLQSWHPN